MLEASKAVWRECALARSLQPSGFQCCKIAVQCRCCWDCSACVSMPSVMQESDGCKSRHSNPFWCSITCLALALQDALHIFASMESEPDNVAPMNNDEVTLSVASCQCHCMPPTTAAMAWHAMDCMPGQRAAAKSRSLWTSPSLVN
jgi:hypothetical protein